MGNIFVEHGKLASSRLPTLPSMVQGEAGSGPQAFSFLSATQFAEKEYDILNSQLATVNRTKAAKLLRETRDSLLEAINDFQEKKQVHDMRVVSAAASAILWLGHLESKLNPIIQGIMNAVKVYSSLVEANL
jgi:TATA-binding protein-associated factor